MRPRWPADALATRSCASTSTNVSGDTSRDHRKIIEGCSCCDGVDQPWPMTGLRALSTSCAQGLLTTACTPFHVKQHRCTEVRPLLYPQGAHACDVVFHVKLRCLWITSVDNFWRAGVPTDRDVRQRGPSRPNG